MLRTITEPDATAVDMAGALDLTCLPTQTLSGLRYLPSASAVYFVIRNDRVLYIGGTINLKARWRDHPERRVLRLGGHVAWLLVDSRMLRTVEQAMIHKFAPPMNKHHIEIDKSVGRKGPGRSYRALQLLIAQESK